MSTKSRATITCLAMAMSSISGLSSAEAALPSPPSELLVAYGACSAAASDRVLPLADAAACADILLEIKLWFLPEMSRLDYEGLSIEARRGANERGYAAFRNWRLSQLLQN